MRTLDIPRFLLVAIMLALPTVAAAKATPEARTVELMEAFKLVKVAKAGESLSDADRNANQATYKTLDTYFDFERITGDAILPHKAAMNSEQLARYGKTFRELIRLVAFPRSGDFVRQAHVQVQKPQPKGSKVDVDVRAKVPEEDVETSITFQWEEVGTQWRVTDVSFNGVSVVKDYQNQFGRLIKKDGVDGFLKKLSTRLEEKRKSDG